jgi:integrase
MTNFREMLNELHEINISRVRDQKQCIVRDEEIERVIQLIINSNRNNDIKSRDKLLINFPRYQGTRISETQRLKVSDMDFQNDRIYIDPSKNGKSRVLGLRRIFKDDLLEYVHKYRPKSQSENLFLTRDGKPLSTDRIEKIFRQLRAESGVQNLTPHSLRRYFCTNLAAKNIPLPHIQIALGHQSISMVMHYCKPDQEKIIAEGVHW